MTSRDDWLGPAGRDWALTAGSLDGLLKPSGDAGLARLAAMAGERIIDIGCGAGATTEALATAVGPGGHVTGIDISPDLAGLARARVAAYPQAEVVEADATTHRFETGADALFSRHGTQFFEDPPAAMANLRRALRPGGRAVFVAWRDAARNQWASVPRTFIAPGLPGPGPRTGPGPFAWADPGVFRPLLAAAGFTEITETAHDYIAEIGTGDDPDPVRRATAFMTRIGPLAARLRHAPAGAMAEAEAFLERRLARFVHDGAVRLMASTWVIEARV